MKAKSFFTVLISIISLLILFMLIKTLLFTSMQVEVDQVNPIEVDNGAIERFSKSLTFETVSDLNSPLDTAAFQGFQTHIRESFPLADSLLELELISGYSMLYTWKGKDPQLEPIILLSHLDVVPADSGTLDEWEAPPFEGAVRDGIIYGRGSLDDKVSLLAIMEAVEMLLEAGFQPNRTIYLAFGHDEEIGGLNGAKKIAELLESRDITASLVLDEGGQMIENMIDGLDKPLAMINVAEKGYVSYQLKIKTQGGHSSTPPARTAIGMLSQAIYDLEMNQLPLTMNSLFETQIRYIGPELPFLYRMAFANSWLFKDRVLKPFYGRTTTAPTLFNSGIKENVLPTEATAVINFRILPGETVETVKEHILETIDNDLIEVSVFNESRNPSPLKSDYLTPEFRMVEKTIKQLHPNCITTPGLIMGGTDAKHFTGISDNIMRFFPLRINPDNLPSVHGINERITESNYLEIVQFYHQLILNSNELQD